MNKWEYYYPRPQLKRNSFMSLNGKWLLNGEEIEIPFSPQADLSGYKGDKNAEDLIYEKSFFLPQDFKKGNDEVYLHFGGVDQVCEVILNEFSIFKHEGGYLPFEIEISKYLRNKNNLKVIVKDDLNKVYPYGKQSKEPKGMWYTPVSGIWQSVWLETIPKNGIKALKVNTTLDTLTIDIDSTNISYIVSIVIDDKKTYRQFYETTHIEIDLNKILDNKHLWSVDDPYLYTFEVSTITDKVESYFALRKVEVIDNKLYLNDKPLLLAGVLDQGYFKDGIYLPEDPQEYFNDVLKMKELGFNLLRKHIKVEPDIFYYACDKLGMLVMQDMVNSGEFDFFKDAVLPTLGFQKKKDRLVDEKRYSFFVKHAKETVNYLHNHPSIIAYTIYNEGWGQQKADDVYKILKEVDPTRLYDATSGWFKQNYSDFDSYHIYFKNKVLEPSQKPLLLSECGGYKCLIKGHVDSKYKEYGYSKTLNEKQLTDKYKELFDNMILPSIDNGLVGYIITQLSDVEGEINGLYTYNREICKVNKKAILKLNKKAYELYESKVQ